MKSISFDRAADNYDSTRGFPPGVGDLVAEAAIELMGQQARALEVGIGTGRIARPLLARNVHVTGLDLSRKMMGRLLETLPPDSHQPALIEGEAVSLPLAGSTFDAVISVHVFHLIANWRAALAETRRVIKPGGVFLSGYDWRPDDSPGAAILEKWREIVQASGIEARHPGVHDFADVKATFIESGATMEERSVGQWTTTRTLARQIETIEHRTWSSTWNVPDDFFPRCLAELREWAIARYGNLDQEFTVPHKFIWQAFR
ncbi:MAG: methyltransferase domain-containing protein [Chloroflexi bacterium]|nr:methyltransferase domain-containing protein [Chloroflexota bacterium]